MPSELKAAAAECGLKLHPEKTKIPTSASLISGRTTSSHAKLDEDDAQILAADEAPKYLGCKVRFKEFHEVELESRITAAWRCSTNTNKD